MDWLSMQFNKEESRLVSKVLKKYRLIDLPAQGTSMFPLIKEGDICTFRSCDPSKLKKGDIVLFFSSESKLVAHRFYQSKRIDNEQLFLFKGDSNIKEDHPITREHIIGKLAFIKRKRKKISITQFQYEIWSKAILLFPIISYWLRSFLNKRETKIT
jgi:signal peptidase